jgi:hypothetical protein
MGEQAVLPVSAGPTAQRALELMVAAACWQIQAVAAARERRAARAEEVVPIPPSIQVALAANFLARAVRQAMRPLPSIREAAAAVAARMVTSELACRLPQSMAVGEAAAATPGPPAPLAQRVEAVQAVGGR